MTGSRYSSRFSNRKGNPKLTLISKCFKKSPSLNVLILPVRSLPSFFLIHVTACICGSTQSGNDEACVQSIPFCTESSSDGSPSLAHLMISTSFVRSTCKLMGSFFGIFLSDKSTCHFSRIRCCLKSKLKAPRYERNDDVTRQSPNNMVLLLCKSSISCFQRVCSEARPLMSFSAAANCRAIVSAASLSWFFSAVAVPKSCLRVSSISASSVNSFFTRASPFCAALSSISAFFTAFRIGLISLATE
mmetsp:Transcript_69913/g.102441  ORF Transcript_69913/g.102441 Transcript_69913/m.102441 type:complete len:246 (+) Transcript_69913:286-1023(+)